MKFSRISILTTLLLAVAPVSAQDTDNDGVQEGTDFSLPAETTESEAAEAEEPFGGNESLTDAQNDASERIPEADDMPEGTTEQKIANEAVQEANEAAATENQVRQQALRKQVGQEASEAPVPEGETPQAEVVVDDRPVSNPPATPTVTDLRSYALGVQLGQNARQVYEGLDIDYEAMARGLADELMGIRSVQLSPYQVEEFVQETRAELRGDTQGLENLRESRQFLEENAKREGVQTLESGLQYVVITEGSGESPSPDDTVSVHYRGTLPDGTEFDSSLNGDPATFPVGGVIPGWQEALVLMKPGAKWNLYIPSHLAYGSSGSGRAIGPHQALIFEVELLEVLGD